MAKFRCMVIDLSRVPWLLSRTASKARIRLWHMSRGTIQFRPIFFTSQRPLRIGTVSRGKDSKIPKFGQQMAFLGSFWRFYGNCWHCQYCILPGDLSSGNALPKSHCILYWWDCFSPNNTVVRDVIPNVYIMMVEWAKRTIDRPHWNTDGTDERIYSPNQMPCSASARSSQLIIANRLTKLSLRKALFLFSLVFWNETIQSLWHFQRFSDLNETNHLANLWFCDHCAQVSNLLLRPNCFTRSCNYLIISSLRITPQRVMPVTQRGCLVTRWSTILRAP